MEIFEESVTLFRQLRTPDPLCRELANLGPAVLGLGEIARAQQHLVEALGIASSIQLKTAVLCALASTALLLAASGQPERAVEVYALASRDPLVANSRWFEDVVGVQVTAASAALPPDVVTAAKARGKARDLNGTLTELLAEFQGDAEN